MRYEGVVYRPPSEADSLLVQATIGCPHNKCRFCGMYKGRRFRIRPLDEVFEDLEMARARFPRPRALFLPDGNTIVIKTSRLARLLARARKVFPTLERVTTYGSARFLALKSVDELSELKRAGLDRVHMGLESGDDATLAFMEKGADRATSVEAGRRVKEAGLELSVYYLAGLGGSQRWREHALNSATAIDGMAPDFVRVRTLRPYPGTPLYDDVRSGRFLPARPHLVLDELETLAMAIKGPTMLLSDHIDNYVNLSGRLPEDRDEIAATARARRGMAESSLTNRVAIL